MGKDHSPGHGGDAAKKLSVQEVTQPAKGVAQGKGYGHSVNPLKDGPLLSPAPENHAQQSADKSAVVGHARKSGKASRLVEGPEDEPGLPQVQAGGVVHQGGKDACPNQQEDNAGGDEAEQVVLSGGIVRCVQGTFPHQPLEHQVGGAEGKDVHEAVPANHAKNGHTGKNFWVNPRGEVYVKQHVAIL